VERRARQIEEEGVKRLVDHVARIALEVVQISCTGADIGLDDAPAALPAFTIRVVAKFDADEIGIVGRKRAAETGQGIVIPRFDHRELGAAQCARDQRGRVLQIKGLPELLSEDTGGSHGDDLINEAKPRLACPRGGYNYPTSVRGRPVFRPEVASLRFYDKKPNSLHESVSAIVHSPYCNSPVFLAVSCLT